MDYADFLSGVYREQLGREPDEGGKTFYIEQLSSGAKTMDQVLQEINNSLEGQNFDTQLLTGEYRTEFGRNPEQEGYQYWMSRMQTDPTLAASTIENYIRGGAAGADITAMGAAPDQFIEIMSAALQADPYAGRYANQDIYKVGGPNLSTLGSAQAQFVNPVNLQPVISAYDPNTGTFTTTAGQDILDPARVANAIKIATNSGALSVQDANSLMSDLSNASNMTDVYNALSRPQAGVVVDRLYGMQLGEDVNMDKARAEALQRAKALQAFDYTPSYSAFGQELVKQNITNPFAPNVFTARTGATPDVVATQQTFPGLLSKTVNQSFGGSNFVPVNIPQGFYSERGLEAQFVPFGQEGAPTFRSGVAGYTPRIPAGFQFGAPVIEAPINIFTPGQFDPNAISYTQEGRPVTEKTMDANMTFFDAQGNPVVMRPAVDYGSGAG